MHRELSRLLKDAKGAATFAMIVDLDIRGFSKATKTLDSAQTGAFLRRAYQAVINEWFPFVSYYKPVGDGLLLVTEYDEEDVDEKGERVLNACMDALRGFSSVCAELSWLCPALPGRLGIGVARGAVCRLESHGKILDYLGTPVNLAFKLANLARPSGTVAERTFIPGSPASSGAPMLATADVYIPGLADEMPIQIMYTQDETSIPQHALRPTGKIVWARKQYAVPLKRIRSLGPQFGLTLAGEPKTEDRILVRIKHPTIANGRQRRGYYTEFHFDRFEYVLDADTPQVILRFDLLADALAEYGLRDDHEVRIEIVYEKK